MMRYSTSLLGLVWLILVSLQPVPGAAQQIDIGIGSPRTASAPPDAKPGNDPAVRPELQLRHVTAKKTNVGTVSPRLAVLRPASVAADLGRIAHFTGESDGMDFRLFLPRSSPLHGTATLHLSLRSAIALLPERSLLQVLVNGHPLEPVTLESFDDFTLVGLDIPSGILAAGVNDVRIDLRQTHRIFCGPQASFELWTDLDLSQSGVEIGPVSEPAIDDFLSALMSDAVSGIPLEIRSPQDLPAQTRAALGDVLSTFASWIEGPPLSFATNAVAPGRAAARITVVPGETPRATFRRGGDGATVLLVEVAGDRVPPLDDLIEAVAAPARPIPAILVGSDVPFAQFGVEPLLVRDHYLSRSYRFNLPDNWLVLNEEKALIRLDYAYADGLPPNSTLLLKINGTPIRLLPLQGDGGHPIRKFPIEFRASLLHAGPNTIGVEAMIPGDPLDLPCIAGDETLVELRPSSTVMVPQTPAMRIPDMTPAVLALGPNSLQGEGAADLSAALTWDSSRTESAAGRQSRLHLVAPSDVAAVPLGPFGIDRRRLAAVVAAKAPPVPPSVPQPAGEQSAPPMNEDGSLWVEPAPSWRPDFSWMSSGVRSLSASIARQTGQIRQLLAPDPDRSLRQWLDGRTGDAILVQLDTTRPGDLWLIIKEDVPFAKVAGALVEARTSGEMPRGQLAVLGSDGTWQSWSTPTPRPALLEPLGPGNLRPVIATFASAWPTGFAGALFLLTFLSAGLALKFVLSSREEP